MSDGIKAKTISKTSMPTGSSSNKEGGGGNVGRISGRSIIDAVRQISTRNFSMLK